MKTFDFSTEYSLRGDVVRYCGESVFKTFESVSATKAKYVLTDDELKEVLELSTTVQGSVDGYLTPLVNQNQPQIVSLPDPRPLAEPQDLDLGFKATKEVVAEQKPVGGSPESEKAPKGTLAASENVSK